MRESNENIMARKYTTRFLLIVAVFSLMLQGCFFGMIRKNEDRLGKRIREYWDARMDNNFEKAYKYECEYTKKKSSFERYLANMYASESSMEGYEIVSMKYDSVKDEYFVKIKKSLKVNLPQLSKLSLLNTKGEVWKFENGDWYRQYVEGNSFTGNVKGKQ